MNMTREWLEHNKGWDAAELAALLFVASSFSNLPITSKSPLLDLQSILLQGHHSTFPTINPPFSCGNIHPAVCAQSLNSWWPSPQHVEMPKVQKNGENYKYLPPILLWGHTSASSTTNSPPSHGNNTSSRASPASSSSVEHGGARWDAPIQINVWTTFSPPAKSTFTIEKWSFTPKVFFFLQDRQTKGNRG